MSNQVDRIRFLDDPTRLEIARLCRDEWLTRAEIAVKLGREAGSLSQPKTMLGRGALEKRPRKKGSDGRGSTAFRLKRSWRKALDEARARTSPAWPVPGQDLLFIPVGEITGACAVLAAGVPGIAWGAQATGGPGGLGGLVLAPSVDDDGINTIHLIEALKGGVPGIARLQFGETMSKSELQMWSSRVSGRGAELPPGP
jgi:hypothetical protein